MSAASLAVALKAAAELRELHTSQAWAFAMGHGCTIGDHPTYRAIREREAHLRALLEEHNPPRP